MMPEGSEDQHTGAGAQVQRVLISNVPKINLSHPEHSYTQTKMVWDYPPREESGYTAAKTPKFLRSHLASVCFYTCTVG